MSEVKDPAIKLFGKTIQLLHHFVDHDHEIVHDKANEHVKKTLEKQYPTTQTEDTCPYQSTSSGINNDDPKTPTTEKETSSKNTTKIIKDNPTEDYINSNVDEKPPKPDKILACPRCNSIDTKFCYYNNYNMNQPRHFCKNCQRYWTAGGTMRNTPVGSGRRKNKSSSSSAASYYRRLIIHDTSLKTNGGVFNFCSDVPLCESMNNKALKFSDKTHEPEHDHSNSTKQGENSQKYPLQIPCFPAPQWPYDPWNSSSQYRPTVSLYPPPHRYCGYNVQVQPIIPWSMQWIPPPNDQISPNSSLGKHSRDGSLLSSSSSSRNNELAGDKDSENGVLLPKTLRINHPMRLHKL